MEKIAFTPSTEQVRTWGRNGFFKAYGAFIHKQDKDQLHESPFVEFSIEGKRSFHGGDRAPVCVRLSPEDAETLAMALLSPALKDAIGWILDLAAGDQQHYLSCGDPNLDYAEEWPYVVATRAAHCRALAEAMGKLFHGEQSRWSDLAADFEESLPTELAATPCVK